MMRGGRRCGLDTRVRRWRNNLRESFVELLRRAGVPGFLGCEINVLDVRYRRALRHAAVLLAECERQGCPRGRGSLRVQDHLNDFRKLTAADERHTFDLDAIEADRG